ncbi:hypothetical protein AYI69_g7885 [Smittium culicis]|uniref:Uncharacterized protein n=1 Tax=Smittium culicis TaxID=133412 RepID=A0A1R1XNS2_9FUNG|nr:hypothetical protein AYI69_g7885 [Smittium culicis]
MKIHTLLNGNSTSGYLGGYFDSDSNDDILNLFPGTIDAGNVDKPSIIGIYHTSENTNSSNLDTCEISEQMVYQEILNIDQGSPFIRANLNLSKNETCIFEDITVFHTVYDKNNFSQLGNSLISLSSYSSST